MIFCQCTNDERQDSITEKNIPIIDRKPHEELPKTNGLKQSGSTLPFFSKRKKSHTLQSERKHIENSNKTEPAGNVARNDDSLLIRKIKYLRKEQLEIDMNEPISKEYILSTVKKTDFPGIIQHSQEIFFSINFDNDILDYTDRFYTNGIRFDLISPIFHQSPLNKLLLPYWKSGINYYGISLVQNIYTPSTTKVDTILSGDRPYSSYLYFGSFKITNDPKSKFRQSSELDLGVIGPFALGESVQKSFHSGVPPNSEPLGWEYQIKNDVILNYSVMMEKGVYMRRNLEIIGNGSSSLGSLYTNMSGGFRFRTGIMNPYFSNLGLSRHSKNKEERLKTTQVYFFLTGNGKLVGYDATLQGGLFNKNSSYSLSASDISRFTFQGTLGLSFVYNGLKIDAEQFLLSPEFHNGWWHKWVHIALTFAL